jgi:hypothetical protein
MIGVLAIAVVKNCGELGRLGKLKIGIIRGFEGWRVSGRYCVCSAWGGGFMGG